MNLLSQSTIKFNRDQVSILRSKGSLPAFEKSIKDHCLLRHGEVGQNIIKNKLFAIITVEEKPHYNSFRPHPTTGKPLPGQRMYAKEVPQEIQLAPSSASASAPEPTKVTTRESKKAGKIEILPSEVEIEAESKSAFSPEEEKQIEEDSIPLTAAAQSQLDRDSVRWEKRRELDKSEHREKKVR